MEKPSYWETVEALCQGQFSQWPTHLQKAGLQTQNTSNTPLHYAVENNLLAEVPKNLLDEKLLLKENYFGDSPFALIAISGDLAPLKGIFTKKNLNLLLQNPNTPKQAIPFLQKELKKHQSLLKWIQSQKHHPL